MAVVTGNPHVDYVVTVVVTYAITAAYAGIDLAKKFYYYYPDVAVTLSIVLGVVFLILFIRNIVSIVYGLIVTLIKLTLALSILGVGSWIYFRGLDNFIADFKQIVTHFSDFDPSHLDEYTSQLKDHTGTLKDYVNEQYQSLI